MLLQSLHNARMNPVRMIFTLLLAWLLAFQAVAGTSGAACRHAGAAAAAKASTAVTDHAAMGHAGHQHLAHRQQTAATEPSAEASAPTAHEAKQQTASCECGCDCAGDCALSSCAGLATAVPPSPAFASASLTTPVPSLLTCAAHGLDLFRPPSIS